LSDDIATPGHGSSGSLTVADLIAKLGAKPERPASHRADPGPGPAEDPSYAPTPTRYPSQAIKLPGSARLDARAADETTELPITDGPVTAETTELPITDGPVTAETTELPITDGPEPKASRRAIAIAGRAVALLSTVLALVLTGGAWQWSNAKNHSLNTVAALDPNSADIIDPSSQYGDENFLITGIDSRAGANADKGARSDTVVLVNIPASRKRVVVVSFPRDLAITPIQCDSWNNDTGKYGNDKVYSETGLNSAYADGGPKCLVKEIQKISGLSISRFMAVDFSGLAQLVDALGGVAVCSPTPLQDHELGTVLARAGRQIVDGQTALNYVQARQVTTEVNGEVGRINRQQLFWFSLLRSLISRRMFFSPGKVNNFVNVFISNSYVDNVKTKDLVDLSQSLRNAAAGGITFLTVPTGVTDADGNQPLRTGDARAIFDAIRNGDPLPAIAALTHQALTSAAAPPASPTDGDATVNAVTAEPKDVTVHVSNSTGKAGLAATAADELRQRGFNVLDPDNYGSSLQATTVFFSPGNEQAAATVSSLLPDPQIEQVAGMGDVVQLVLGPDFNSVGAPPPSGSAVKVHVTNGPAATPPTIDPTASNAADATCEEPAGG
jgi:LCP family protein required for cell wall assembly